MDKAGIAEYMLGRNELTTDGIIAMRDHAGRLDLEGKRAMNEQRQQSRWARALVIVMGLAVAAGTIGSVLIAIRLMK